MKYMKAKTKRANYLGCALRTIEVDKGLKLVRGAHPTRVRSQLHVFHG